MFDCLRRVQYALKVIAIHENSYLLEKYHPESLAVGDLAPPRSLLNLL